MKRDLVLLWARAAGMCSHPDCKRKLVVEAPQGARTATVGQVAHIVARRPLGPRGKAAVDQPDLHAYSNLILLCANHHSEVDGLPEEYSVERLRAWKAEHEAWVESAIGTISPDVPWTAVIQEEGHRIDTVEALGALGGGSRAVETVELRGPAERERRLVESMLESTPPERRRFAVFSMGPVPLAVQLGYVLQDRGRVALYQYDRDRATWRWPDEPRPGTASLTERLGREQNGEAAIRVSLSGSVARADTAPAAVEIEIDADRPAVRWLRSREQLTALSLLYDQALRRIRGRCRRIHLYYAGPAAGAICFGRAYNPRMNPALQLYEYRHGERPCYQPALELNRT